MTIHVEEFQLSKLTTVSLCDTVDSLGNTIQKANRGFDISESLLHTRANSFAKKIYKACNLKPDSLGTVSLTKPVTDFEKLLEEIKTNVGDELTDTYNRLDIQFEKVFAKHTEYYTNDLVIQSYTLQYQIAAHTHEYESDVDNLVPALQTELDSLTSQITEYNTSFIQTSASILTKLNTEYVKYTTIHNKNISSLLNNEEVDLYLEKEALKKYKTKIIEEVLDSKGIIYIGLYILNHLMLMSLDGVSGLTDVISFVNKYKAWFKAENDKKLAADEAYDTQYASVDLDGLWQYFFDTPEGDGEQSVIRMRAIEQAELTLVPYLVAQRQYDYLGSFTSWINDPEFIEVQVPNIEHEPKLDLVSYQDPDVNFFNTKLVFEIFGHPSLNIESNTYLNRKQLLSIEDVYIDKYNPLLIKSGFSLRSGYENLEHILPESKVFHIGYKFILNGTTTYGYISSDTLTTKLDLETTELDFKSIPYTPIKLQNESLAKDKRLDKDSLYFEEFLRNLYVPYYKIDSKVTKIGLASYTVNTDSKSLTYPLNDAISNVGIGIGVPVISESKAVCEYLTYLFSKVIDSKDKEGFDKWIIGEKGTDVNNIDKFPYLYENNLSFKSDMGEILIGYSYIEQEEKEGKLSAPSSKIIKGTNAEIFYGSNQRFISFGSSILISSPSGRITSHIHGNKLYYDNSKLEIKVATGKDKHTVTTVYGFTHTFIANGNYPLKELDPAWVVNEYESTRNTEDTYKYFRTTKDSIRTTFGTKINETTSEVVTTQVAYKRKITVVENNKVSFKEIDANKEIEPKDNVNVSIPLIYFDIRDKESDYYKLKLINKIESVFFDSIQLHIVCTIPDEQRLELDSKLRSKLLYSYLDFFLDPELSTESIDGSNAKFNKAEANRNRENNSRVSNSFTANYKTSGDSFLINSVYQDFREDNYVGIGLTYYNAIPKRNPDPNLDPVFLEYQMKREVEVNKQLTQGNKSNLYNDRDSHTNNALTGVYKPKVFIEPFINIGDRYKKPMFNN